MKHRIILFLAIALVFGDISYLLVDHFVSELDHLIPLLAINGLFGLFSAVAFFDASQNLQVRDKLPLAVRPPAPSPQFSDQLLIRHFPDLLCLKDPDGRWLNAAPEYLASFNLQDVDYFGKTDFELAQVDGSDAEGLKSSAAHDKEAWMQGARVIEVRGLLQTGAPENLFEIVRTPVFDAEQNRFRLIVTGNPAGEYEKKRTRLELLELGIRGSHIAYALLDADLHIIECNGAFARLTGFSADELAGKSITTIFGRDEKTSRPLSVEVLFKEMSRKNNRFEFDCQHGDGKSFPVRLEVAAIKTDKRGVIHFASLSDMTEQRLAAKRLQQIMHSDDLTGLANRTLFLERLGQFIANSGRYRLHAVVMSINLDRFKAINESLGHAAGDELLKITARRLGQITRKGDVLARLSGDEFALLLLSDKEHERAIYAASLVAQKIIKNLSEAFYIQRREVFVGVSIGISIFPEDGVGAEILMRNADIAMKEAKIIGLNNYQFFRKDYKSAVEDRLTLELNLRKALHINELQLYFQPQYLAKDRLLCGAEVLIRWLQVKNGQPKMVPPNFFIPVAEHSGLIVEIGKWILRTACTQIKIWHEKGILLPQVSVNISARQFSDPDFLQIVEDALRDSALAPEYLELEITESMLIGDIKRIELQLKRLKKMGIRVALDDFGTGYSSLSYLKNFPVDVLKIDQSFIREMTRDSRDANIARAIIEMGHSLGQNIVAEGVETEEQLRLLVHRDCDIIQGYFFSPPLPGNKMTDLLQQQKNKIGKLKPKSLWV